MEITTEEWSKLIREAMSDDPDCKTNFKFDFKILTKKYGKAYIEYLKAAYLAKGDLSNKEFCRLNHCPLSFLNKCN